VQSSSRVKYKNSLLFL